MKAEINFTKYLNRIEFAKKDILTVLGAISVTWITDKIRTNKSIVTTNLINSITYSTESEQLDPIGDTNGVALQAADKDTVRVGTNVVYAARVEFGFVGEDSLGRNYNQPAKSYLRDGIKAHRGDIKNILKKIKI